MKTVAALLALLAGLLPTMGIPQGVKLPESDPFMVRARGCAADVLEVTAELVPEGARPTCSR